MKSNSIFNLLTVLCFGLMCTCGQGGRIYIYTGDKATTREISIAIELSENIMIATGKQAVLVEEDEKAYRNGTIILMGTPLSNSKIRKLSDDQLIKLSSEYPGSRGGIWKKVAVDDTEVILLAGSDFQGLQYAISDYSSEVLNTDLLSYWTGTEQVPDLDLDLFSFKDTIIAPPQVPILCYFENDVDELANLKEPLLEYDWETYTEMIDALVAMRYNAIQLFDMLGRPEFFLRPEYKQLRPGYDIRMDYIENMIDYAQEKGVMVQIDMSMGYKIRPLDQEYADCWKENKDKWIETWNYYFNETPIGKADIFSLRPRNQVWDWEYKSSCGENKIDVFNQVYAELDQVIDKHKPGAYKVVICYHDGMEMFNQGFNPPKDWIVAWSDDGWGGFDYLPESTKGYAFGTYMHAGFWKNHTVHDPYPEKVESIMKVMFSEYQADQYCQVNGQQFRPFLLNLEAYSQVTNNPDRFDGGDFYNKWANKYFSDNAAEWAVESMKLLHEAQYDKIGYVEHLWEIREAIAYLTNSPIKRPGKTPIPYDVQKVLTDIESVNKRENILNIALEIASQGLDTKQNGAFYHDYIYLPILLYHDLLSFEMTLHQLSVIKNNYEESGKKPEGVEKLLIQAQEQLDTMYKRRLEGDQNPKWNSWYDPLKRRPNNGFPGNDEMRRISSAQHEWKSQAKPKSK